VRQRAYRLIWRWHFYAGLFCLPFVLWLATTGTIYLFRPQVEPWLERQFAAVSAGPTAPASQQVQAALRAVPNSSLFAYEVPQNAGDATRVLVARDGAVVRVFVDPSSARVLGTVADNDRFMRVVQLLHGELLMGSGGSMMVELAASWTILMLLTGLYLWWPRTGGLGGGVYPRWRAGWRVFWRDLHAVTGMWVAFFALFLLVSGLPWAKSWGGMLKTVRQVYSAAATPQDWSTGSASERAAIRAIAPAHAHHSGGEASASAPADLTALDRVLPAIAEEHLASPVLVAPPSRKSPNWIARSDAANRPARSDLVLDGQTGVVVSRTDFAQRPWLDQVIGYGIAIHEGQLFPPLNQILGVMTALGLITMSISSVVLWWRRRAVGTLGAPSAEAGLRFPRLFVAGVALLGCILPLLGVSLLLVLLLEWSVLRRSRPVAAFLGLRA
jgi:uncharacterized iron-regulated membrane protein